MIPQKEEIAEWFRGLQDSICRGLEEEDGVAVFHEDLWDHHSGGGGRSRVIENGAVFEKGGVNFSAVSGKLPSKLVEALKTPEDTFFATGVSIVIHPGSPHVPIIHMNVRYFEMGAGTWWFGGGIDLTPIYVDEKDAKTFHQGLQAACDKHEKEFYPKFSAWADDYFFIPHRNETRGIGGIFYDRLSGENKANVFAFTRSVG